MLAFDYGTHFVGVAVGNTALRLAQPLTTIVGERSAERFGAIARLVAEWAPRQLVVGRPLENDGSENPMTARAERFARQLEGRFGLPVARVDERYTSRAAASLLAETGLSKRARAAAIDEVAAQLILQAWLDQAQPRTTHGAHEPS